MKKMRWRNDRKFEKSVASELEGVKPSARIAREQGNVINNLTRLEPELYPLDVMLAREQQDAQCEPGSARKIHIR